jgi:hypothetical protein
VTEPVLRLPHRNSRWVWEIDKDHARVLVEVIEVRFLGGEWGVHTRSLPDAPDPMFNGSFNSQPGRLSSPKEDWNDLDRFWEACLASPIGGRLDDLSNRISKSQYKRSA